VTTLRAVPLTPERYARYGSVVMAGRQDLPPKSANQGTAERFDHQCALEDLRPGRSRANLTVFRCKPREVWPFPLRLLERHALSTQVFLPMNARRYLAVVCLGGERPDPETLGVFLASGTQGVSYHPGVWHHPMIALDSVTDFACLVWEDGTEGDCEVVYDPLGGDAWIEV
jgi:ureidoglycolate lyase